MLVVRGIILGCPTVNFFASPPVGLYLGGKHFLCPSRNENKIKVSVAEEDALTGTCYFDLMGKMTGPLNKSQDKMKILNNLIP